MFWLGVVELAPLGVGLGLGGLAEWAQPFWAWALGGGAACAMTCWWLRGQTPPTVIHAVEEVARRKP